MAITTTQAPNLIEGSRVYPINDHGKLRFMTGLVTQGAAAGDDGSFVEFFRLPPGRVRVLPWLGRLRCSALGASRVLKIGHRAYQSQAPGGGVNPVAEDDDAFASGLNVSAAALVTINTADLKGDMYSRSGIVVYGTVTGGTIPAAAQLELMLPYLYE